MVPLVPDQRHRLWIWATLVLWLAWALGRGPSRGHLQRHRYQMMLHAGPSSTWWSSCRKRWTGPLVPRCGVMFHAISVDRCAIPHRIASSFLFLFSSLCLWRWPCGCQLRTSACRCNFRLRSLGGTSQGNDRARSNGAWPWKHAWYQKKSPSPQVR